MTRLRGRARRGERVIAAPHMDIGIRPPSWPACAVTGSWRLWCLTAPSTAKRSVPEPAPAKAGVEQFLAPTLEPDDVVIADNLGSHKVAGVREAIEARGARLMFLPAYSPDMNPIKQVFAKLKQLLRNAAPRTRPTLWKAIGKSLHQFTPNECTNYLANAGYGHSA